MLYLTVLALFVVVLQACSNNSDNAVGKLGADDVRSSSAANNAEDGKGTAKTEKNDRLGQLRNVSDFSNGKTFYQSGDGTNACIDKNGNVVFDIKLSSEVCAVESAFLHGVTYTFKRLPAKLGEKLITNVINEKGENIITPETHGYTAICINEHTSDCPMHGGGNCTGCNCSSLKGGYVIVYKLSETYDGVNFEIGALNTSGKWINKLSDENPISALVKKSNRTPAVRYYYCDDDMILFSVGNTINDKQRGIFWNLKNNKWFVIDDVKFNNKMEDAIHFENGITVFEVLGRIYTLTNEGVLNVLYTDANGLCGPYYNGLFFCKREYRDENNEQHSSCGFIDSNGNLIIDLSKYEINSTYYYNSFCGDFALLRIRDTSSLNYFTLIDKNGEFAFKPIKMYQYNTMVSFSENLISLLDYDGEKLLLNCYDTHGILIYSIPASDKTNNVYPSKYSDGYIRVYDNGKNYFVDTEGNRVLG